MIHITLRQTHNSPSHNPQTPTEIYLLVMCKESSVESSCLPVVFCTYHQCSTCGPENICSIVILTIILFYRLEDTSPTERIAESVEISPTRPCIFKTVLIKDAQQLRLTGRHIIMAVEILYHRSQPVMGYLDIRIQKKIILCIYLLQGFVISFGKSPVLFEDNKFYLREMRTEQFQRVIRRGIIRHIYRCFITGILNDRRKILSEHLLAVPV